MLLLILGMYWKIKSLLGYDRSTKTVYAVSGAGDAVVKSLDPGYKEWQTIQLKEWNDVMHMAATVWATEIPFIPDTDEIDMTIRPRTPLTKTATNNDKWGGKQQFHFYN